MYGAVSSVPWWCFVPSTDMELTCTTRVTPAAAAASIRARVPSTLTASAAFRSSQSPTSAAEWKTRSTPSTARLSDASSAISPWTSSTPRSRRSPARAGSRTSPRTSSPRSTRASALLRPTQPVAPVTSERMSVLLSRDPADELVEHFVPARLGQEEVLGVEGDPAAALAEGLAQRRPVPLVVGDAVVLPLEDEHRHGKLPSASPDQAQQPAGLQQARAGDPLRAEGIAPDPGDQIRVAREHRGFLRSAEESVRPREDAECDLALLPQCVVRLHVEARRQHHDRRDLEGLREDRSHREIRAEAVADQVDGSGRRLLAGARDDLGHLLEPVAVAIDMAALVGGGAAVVQELARLGEPLRVALEAVDENEARRRLGPPPGIAVDVRGRQPQAVRLGPLAKAEPAGD